MTAQTILPANTLSSGYDVANSYMFGGDANTAITNTTPTDTKIFTISLWIKFHEFPTSGGDRIIYGYYSADNTQAYLYLRNDFTLGFYEVDGGTSKIDFRTTQFFRDSAAWYHIVVAIDTSQGTDTNRFKLYVNGSQVSAFNANSYPDQNYASMLNENSLAFNVGGTGFSSSKIHASICEFVFIDGSQLAPTSFGEFDSDSPTIWKPKSVSGLTFGNNGSYLEFKETGTSANSSGAGADTSGNDRHHSVTNLAATDQRTDTCTNNFCTFTAENHTAANFDLTEGNLQTSRNSGTSGLHGSSIMPTTGKWYFEVKIGEAGSGDRSRVGVMNYQKQLENSTYSGVINTPQQVLAGCTTSCKSGKHFEGDGAGVMEEYTASGDYADGDIVQVAMDLDNKAIYFGRNGTFLTRTGNSGGDPTSGASKTGAITTNTNIMDGSPMTAYTGLSVGSGTDQSTMLFNFGNPPFAISSGNNDGNGYGNFEHAPPAGYLAWCTKNLGESG